MASLSDLITAGIPESEAILLITSSHDIKMQGRLLGYAKKQSSLSSFEHAICNRDVELGEWLVDKKVSLPRNMEYLLLIKKKDPDYLKTLITHGMPIPENVIQYSLPDKELAAWFISHGAEIGHGTIITAAEFGPGCLEFLVENGAVLDAEFFISTAQSGNIDSMNWLKTKNCPMSAGIYEGVVNCLDAVKLPIVLEWLVANDCPRDVSAVHAAIQASDIASFNFFVKHGFPLVE